MKLLVIGLGQCGSNIADSFARINKRARARRGIEIVTGAFAVNTDVADLTGLTHIKADYKHRILIGGRKSGGHGVGKINELAADMMKEDADKVIDAIRSTPSFFESDAFLLCASAAGGTGSGSIGTMTKVLKDRYIDKPIYNLIVLPFEHEEHTEERTVYNTATCLKSADSVADAVFLVDNQRYVKKNSPLKHNFAGINETIAEPFYNILCAGEEKKAKYVGARLLDAGDIIQSIAGWTVIGHGQAQLPSLRIPFQNSDNFRRKSSEIYRGIEAMDAALSELSFKCDPAEASRGLYLVSGPGKEINLSSIGEIGEYLKILAPEAVMRNGDYPRDKATLSVSVILSELRVVDKVRQYYSQTAKIISARKKRQRLVESQLREIEEASRDVPSLVTGS
ncbi:MAG TPA: tubulin/FtsZ family protein [Dehalococcoidales bacterium]|nr:tubulin/FtsZ family protein [Dehalococcoidales bacterium]